MNTERLRNVMALECGERIDPPMIERICAEMNKTTREAQLEELLRSAVAIAERKGESTAWERFKQSAAKLGINGITARTYRLLQDEQA